MFLRLQWKTNKISKQILSSRVCNVQFHSVVYNSANEQNYVMEFGLFDAFRNSSTNINSGGFITINLSADAAPVQQSNSLEICLNKKKQ